MAFWDKVKGELTKAAQESWEAVKGGARVAAEKSEEMARVGKLRYKVHMSHKKAENLFTDLGGVVYELAKPPYENPLSKAEVMSLVEKIKAVEEETAKIEEEMERVKKKEAASAGAPPANEPPAEEPPAKKPSKEKKKKEEKE